MRERFVLAPGANGSELLKSLALHGVNCFNLRIVGVAELARIALMRSGVAVTEDFLSAREETALITEAIKGEEYFGKTSYSDIREIAGAVRRMRTLVADGDEQEQIAETLEKGVFKEKNRALLSVYRKYMRILADRKLVDSVSLIRKALSSCEAMDADFFALEEYPLSPLERALLDKLSEGKAQIISLFELFGIEKTSPKIKSYKNCYGAPNEVETILADIYSGKPLDQCTVAVTDAATHGQLFFDYALLYDIPVSFGCGIPVINSYPAKLLVLYYHWMTDGFFGAAAVKGLLSSVTFDRDKLESLFPEKDESFSRDTLMEVFGGIRFTNDRKVNRERMEALKKALEEEEQAISPEDKRAYKSFLQKKSCLPFMEVLSEELALPVEDFIYKYARVRKSYGTNAQNLLMRLDLAAKEFIYDELQVIRRSGMDFEAEDVIRYVLKSGVKDTQNAEGKLCVTDIDGALCSVRENLYLVGLSSSKYPGSPSENYLLLDADLKQFGSGADYMTSEGRVRQKRDRLLTLARLASGLGASISVSYAGMNVSELKRDNASSLIFELYREETGRNIMSKELGERIEKTGYFDPAISVTSKVGEAYSKGKMVLAGKVEPVTGEEAGSGSAPSVYSFSDKEYSPSALEVFFNCPREFMLKNLLGISQPEEENVFEIIAPTESGTMAHLLMERLAGPKMGCEEFLALAGEYFDRFLSVNPPVVKEHAEAERDRFLDMMNTAFDMEPHREVVLKEEDIHCVHESGVKLRGFPDRVEKLEDGSFLVVDFKTGGNVKHTQDDIDTCLQVAIYAYLLEQQGYKVSGGEYRYIKLNKTVTFRYDEEMRQKLGEKLAVFRECLEKASFPISENVKDSDTCKYCKFGFICGKAQMTGGADDE